MQQALLFDLDGTLIDSVPDIASAVDATLQTLGYDPVGQAQCRAWLGNGAKVLIARAVANAQGVSCEALADNTVEQALAHFKVAYDQCCCDQSVLYPQVVNTLRELSARYPMAIVTNKPLQFAQKMVQYYGLSEYCTVLVGGDCLASRKPEPEMLMFAAKQLGVSLDACIMVGDSAADIGAALNAGIPCITFDYGYHRGVDLKAAGATRVLASFEQLLDFLV